LVEEFFALAKATAACSPAEEYLRSAISRVYFANHLLAINRARKFAGFSTDGNADDPARVIRILKQGRARRFGELLGGLRERRNHADYHTETPSEDCPHCRDGVTVKTTDWEECLAEAEKCFDGLRRL
jgi:hypothetical protein